MHAVLNLLFDRVSKPPRKGSPGSRGSRYFRYKRFLERFHREIVIVRFIGVISCAKFDLPSLGFWKSQ